MATTLQAGINSHRGIGLTLFSDDDLYVLHCATLDVLFNVGIKVTDKDAREIFLDNGAIAVPNSDIIKFPSYMVEDAIKSAPSTLLLAGRDPKNDFLVYNRSIGFTNFGEAIKVVNPHTGVAEPSSKEKLADATRICDALENIDVIERALGADDVPGEVQSIHNGEAIFNNTTKHVFMGANCGYNYKQVVKMAAAISGGMENLRQRPIYTPLACPNSPLTMNLDLAEVVIGCAEAGLPVNVISMALAGGTSPVTLAGTLICHNAEVLSGLVLNQLVRRGAPFIYGSSTTLMDLRFTTASVGAPELGMLSAGVAKLAQYYQLPSFVAGG